MIITFDNVLPIPLAGLPHSNDSIWGNKIMFDSTIKTCLNAASGKGKSTFTSIVCGLRSDYTGSVFFDDQAISTFQLDEWTTIRKEKIAVIFQDLQLFPQLSVCDNLLLKNKLTDYKTEKEIRLLLDQLAINNKWNEPCGLLSIGQQQRVAIIRALCQPFSWLVMDEPFSHLDEQNKVNCIQLIVNEVNQQQAGFVLTSLDKDQRFAYDSELKL